MRMCVNYAYDYVCACFPTSGHPLGGVMSCLAVIKY